jgi:hypothetical protein
MINNYFQLCSSRKFSAPIVLIYNICHLNFLLHSFIDNSTNNYWVPILLQKLISTINLYY